MRFVIDSEAAYDEVARLDPDGRGDVRCDLSPGDAVRLSPRLWRVSGSRRNAYVVVGDNCAVIDADVHDAVQLQALSGLGVGPVMHLLFSATQAGDAAQLNRHWPLAQHWQWPADGQAPQLRLGGGATLQGGRLSNESGSGLYWRLEEDAVLLGGNAAGLQAPELRALGVDWLAPAQGFLVRCGSG
jgi:hypothetical protein